MTKSGLITPDALSFGARELVITSSSAMNPVSVTFFRLNGRALQKDVVVRPVRSRTGFTYTCRYPVSSSGLYIVQVKLGGGHVFRKILVR